MGGTFAICSLSEQAYDFFCQTAKEVNLKISDMVTVRAAFESQVRRARTGEIVIPWFSKTVCGDNDPTRKLQTRTYAFAKRVETLRMEGGEKIMLTTLRLRSEPPSPEEIREEIDLFSRVFVELNLYEKSVIFL